MKKVRIGVMGVYRGTSMINYCRQADNAQIVAMCDKWVEGLETQKQIYGDDNIAYYTDFDEFIKHDMDFPCFAKHTVTSQLTVKHAMNGCYVCEPH